MKLKVGDIYEKIVVVTDEIVRGFAKYSGDTNPIHLDDEYAGNSIFKKRIAHGLLLGSFISAVLGNEYPGNGTIYLSQNLKFLAPVFIDDEITIKFEVLEFPNNKRVLFSTKCYNQDQNQVLDGEAVILPPQGTELDI